MKTGKEVGVREERGAQTIGRAPAQQQQRCQQAASSGVPKSLGVDRTRFSTETVFIRPNQARGGPHLTPDISL